MSTICENVDCPICMDIVEGNNNRVTTECGHCFHTSCLMKSVAHNGFGCPYCRSIMAEKIDDSDSDSESEWSEIEDDTEENNALEGMRILFERAEGTYVPPPTAEDINRKMMEKGYTMLDILKVILTNYDECYDEHEHEDQIAYADKVIDDLNDIINELEI